MIKEKFRQTAIKIIHFLNKLKTQLIVILQQTNRTNLNTKFTSIKIIKQYKTNHENNHWNNIVILINQVIFFRQIPQQPQQPHQEFSQKQNQAPPSKNTQKTIQILKVTNPNRKEAKYKISSPYYLQQHEITENQFTNFTLIPNTAESVHISNL